MNAWLPQAICSIASNQRVPILIGFAPTKHLFRHDMISFVSRLLCFMISKLLLSVTVSMIPMQRSLEKKEGDVKRHQFQKRGAILLTTVCVR